MSNIVITAVTDKNYHKVVFNDLASKSGYEYKYFWVEDIKDVEIDANSGNVIMEMKTENRAWILSFNGSNKSFQVDSVLGASPASNDELASMLANLKG